MKRLIVFCMLLVMAALTVYHLENPTGIFEKYPSAEVLFFVDDNARVPEFVRVEKNGVGKVIRAAWPLAYGTEKALGDIKGKAIIFEAEENDFNEIVNLLGIQVLKEERLSDIRTLYGFVRGEAKSIFIDGKKVNVQMAYGKGIITIGYPIILGSY